MAITFFNLTEHVTRTRTNFIFLLFSLILIVLRMTVFYVCIWSISCECTVLLLLYHLIEKVKTWDVVVDRTGFNLWWLVFQWITFKTSTIFQLTAEILWNQLTLPLISRILLIITFNLVIFGLKSTATNIWWWQWRGHQHRTIIVCSRFNHLLLRWLVYLIACIIIPPITILILVILLTLLTRILIPIIIIINRRHRRHWPSTGSLTTWAGWHATKAWNGSHKPLSHTSTSASATPRTPSSLSPSSATHGSSSHARWSKWWLSSHGASEWVLLCWLLLVIVQLVGTTAGLLFGGGGLAASVGGIVLTWWVARTVAGAGSTLSVERVVLLGSVGGPTERWSCGS